MTNPGGNKNEEIQTLIQNMEAFNEVTSKLQHSYEELQERVKKLDLELSDKNEELQKIIQDIGASIHQQSQDANTTSESQPDGSSDGSQKADPVDADYNVENAEDK